MPVKPKYIKESGAEVFEMYPDKVSTDFDKNKIIVNKVMNVSRPVRNRIAGHITRLVVRRENNEEEPLQ